jgi:hypothetical protein
MLSRNHQLSAVPGGPSGYSTEFKPKSPEFESSSEPVLTAYSKQEMEGLTHHGRAGCLPSRSKVRICMARWFHKFMVTVTIINGEAHTFFNWSRNITMSVYIHARFLIFFLEREDLFFSIVL